MANEEIAISAAMVQRYLFDMQSRDFNGLSRLIAPDIVYIRHSAYGQGEIKGHDAYVSYTQAVWEERSDFLLEVQNVVAGREQAAVQYILRPVEGTNKPPLYGADFFIFHDGLITHHETYLVTRR